MATGVTAVGNVLFHVFLARGAGVDTYGGIVGLLSFGTIATTIQSGIQYAVARKASLGEPPNSLLAEGAWASLPWLFGVALVAAFSGPISHYLHLSGPLPALLAVGYAVALVALGAPSGILIGRRRFGVFAIIISAAVVIRFSTAAAIGWHRDSGSGALFATFFSVAVAVLATVVFVWRRYRNETPVVAAPSRRRLHLAADSAYGALLSAALWACWSLPVLFASHYLSSSAAGSFGAVQLLTGGVLLLTAAFAGSFHPIIVKHRRVRDILLGLAGTASVCLVGTVGSTVLGPTLLHNVYGTRFSASSSLFLVLSLSAAAIAVATYWLWVAQGLQAQQHTMAIAICIALLAEIGFGPIWHSPLQLAAGPGLSTLVGASVALAWAAARRTAPQRDARLRVVIGGGGDAAPVRGSAIIAKTAVGMMVHNEVESVEQCLRAVLGTRDGEAVVPTVVVVVSGSTDGTDDVVRRIAATDPRVKLIVEPTRSGKANAINMFIAATDEPVLALVGGDTLLAPGSLVRLVEPMADDAVGMTGCHVVPTNARRHLANRLVHVLWELHHLVAMHKPKMGEAVAFRRTFDAIDPASLVDEVSIEAEIRAAGLEFRYVPEAIVYNHGPETLSDYFRQRTRIHRGHCAVHDETGYSASTMSTGLLARSAIELAEHDPNQIPLLALASGLEVAARTYGRFTRKRHQARGGVWTPIRSAKRSFEIVVDITDPPIVPINDAPILQETV